MNTILRVSLFATLLAFAGSTAFAQSATLRFKVVRTDSIRDGSNPSCVETLGFADTREGAQAMINSDYKKMNNQFVRYFHSIRDVGPVEASAPGSYGEYMDVLAGVQKKAEVYEAIVKDPKSGKTNVFDMIGGEKVPAEKNTINMTRKKLFPDGKAKTDPKGRTDKSELDEKGKKAISDLNEVAERENAKNKAVGFKKKTLDEIDANQKEKQKDVEKKIEAPNNEMKKWLEGLPEGRRKSVIDEIEKAIPGFKKDLERNSEGVYKKYFESEGKLNKSEFDKSRDAVRTYEVKAHKMYRDYKALRDELDMRIPEGEKALDRMTKAELEAQKMYRPTILGQWGAPGKLNRSGNPIFESDGVVSYYGNKDKANWVLEGNQVRIKYSDGSDAVFVLEGDKMTVLIREGQFPEGER